MSDILGDPPRDRKYVVSLSNLNAVMLEDYCKRMQIKRSDFLKGVILKALHDRGVAVDLTDDRTPINLRSGIKGLRAKI